MPMSRNLRVAAVCLFSAIGSFLFGLDMGYIGPIIEDGQFKRDVGHLADWEDASSQIDSVTSGFIVSVFALGCMFSSCPLVSRYFLDSLGRNASLKVGSLVFMVGSFMQAASYDIYLMVVGRFVSGCSVGILSTVVPLYQSELAPPHLRGAMTATSQLMIVFGVAVASLADALLLPLANGWRFAILVPVIPGVALFFGMFFLPSSPRWLVQKGKKNDALDVLKSIREEGEAFAELQDIILHVKLDSTSKKEQRSILTDLCSGRVLRLLLVGLVLQMLQQLTGINVVVSFGPRIWLFLGLDAQLLQTLVTFSLFLATIPATCLIERFGRRTLLIAGALGMLVPNVVMAVLGMAYTRQVDGEVELLNQAAGGAIAASVFVFVMSFAFSWGPATWVYCAEIFPLRVRGTCVGLTTMSEWTGVFIINQLTPILLSELGFGTYIVLAAFSVAALVLAVWLPETKGVPLEHMHEIFDAKFGVASAKSQDSPAKEKQVQAARGASIDSSSSTTVSGQSCEDACSSAS